MLVRAVLRAAGASRTTGAVLAGPVRALSVAAPSVQVATVAVPPQSSLRAAPERRRALDLPADLRPRKVDGVWRKPRLSGREASLLRKEAVREGLLGSFDPATGKGWDLSWDRPRTATVAKPPKQTAADRSLFERVAKIEKALAGQEQRVAEFRKTRPPKRPRRGFSALLRKNAWEK